MRSAAAVILFLILFPSAALPASTVLSVRAQILPSIRMNVLSSPSSYSVTEEDVGRGYVDIPSPTLLTMETNIDRDLVLSVVHHGPEQVVVRTAEGGSAGGQTVVVACAPHIPSLRAIHYRVYLTPAMSPGTYPLPLVISSEVL